MISSYKYKIKPDETQSELLSKFFGYVVMFVYNWSLNSDIICKYVYNKSLKVNMLIISH